MTRTVGQCRCGEVEFVVTGDVKSVVNCHCSMCRSINGGAFSTYVVVSLADLAVTRGKEMLSSYSVTENASKKFCSSCGTPVFNVNPIKYPGLSMLYVGILENQSAFRPVANIFCENMLPWVNSITEAKNFNGAPEANT